MNGDHLRQSRLSEDASVGRATQWPGQIFNYERDAETWRNSPRMPSSNAQNLFLVLNTWPKGS